jgi:predicted component of type VI protein secretion system
MMGALCAQLSRGWKRNRAIRAALDRFESRIYDERDTI